MLLQDLTPFARDTYDGAGNRLTDAKVPGNWEYTPSNQLTAYGAAGLTYDANGSVVSKIEDGVVEKYGYNLENRLDEVRDGADVLIARYGYDPFGRRLWKEVGSVRTYFLYAEEGLVAEMDAGGVITRQYGWQPGGTWGTDPVYLSAGGATYFYQNDHLGTPQKLVGLNGTVVWAAKYEAFGMAYSDVQQIENPLRFPGQYYDWEVGLNQNYFRTYNPRIGRYSKADPIGLSGGLNGYAYADGNPLRKSDPDGLSAVLFAGCMAILQYGTYQSWESAITPPDTSLIDDQLRRIDERMAQCTSTEEWLKLKLIRDELVREKIRMAAQHADNNKSNAAHVATAQAAISTAACALLLFVPTP